MNMSFQNDNFSKRCDGVNPLVKSKGVSTGDTNSERQKPPAADGGIPTDNDNRDEIEIIKYNQQLLLLLYHSSKCTGDSNCKRKQECAKIRQNRRHMEWCQSTHCDVPHCVSSRAIMFHYLNCEDINCPSCAPVRNSMRDNVDIYLMRITNDIIGPTYPALPHVILSDDSVPPSQSVGDGLSSNQQVLSSLSSENMLPRYLESEPKRMKTEEIISIGEVDGFPTRPIQHYVNPKIPCALQTSHEIVPHSPISSEHVVGAPNAQVTKSESKVSVEKFKGLDRDTQLSPSDWVSKCINTLNELQIHNNCSWIFSFPVDPYELGLPDYFEIIKTPMDLGTVQKRLENGFYHCIDEFASDVILTFDNATTYNKNGSEIYNIATEMKAKFYVDFSKLRNQLGLEAPIQKGLDARTSIPNLVQSSQKITPDPSTSSMQ